MAVWTSFTPKAAQEPLYPIQSAPSEAWWLQQLQRAGHSTTAVGHLIYVVGGRRGSRFLNNVVVWDTKKHEWSLLHDQLDFPERAHHHAALIGNKIWIVGGADAKTVHDDIWVLDLDTHTWSQPPIRGRTDLLGRCAGGMTVHPQQPHILLLFGGYGGRLDVSEQYQYFNDIISIDTTTGDIQQVTAHGPAPSPRTYHTFTAVEGRCWAVGGRLPDSSYAADAVAVYDPVTQSWLHVTVQGTDGNHVTFSARSSHKAVAVGGQLLITGGSCGSVSQDKIGTELDTWLYAPDSQTSANAGLDRDSPLVVSWQPLHGNDQKQQPSGICSHGCCLIGPHVYLVLGYTSDDRRSYRREVVSLDVTARLTMHNKLKGGGKPLSPTRYPAHPVLPNNKAGNSPCRKNLAQRTGVAYPPDPVSKPVNKHTASRTAEVARDHQQGRKGVAQQGDITNATAATAANYNALPSVDMENGARGKAGVSGPGNGRNQGKNGRIIGVQRARDVSDDGANTNWKSKKAKTIPSASPIKDMYATMPVQQQPAQRTPPKNSHHATRSPQPQTATAAPFRAPRRSCELQEVVDLSIDVFLGDKEVDYDGGPDANNPLPLPQTHTEANAGNHITRAANAMQAQNMPPNQAAQPITQVTATGEHNACAIPAVNAGIAQYGSSALPVVVNALHQLMMSGGQPSLQGGGSCNGKCAEVDTLRNVVADRDKALQRLKEQLSVEQLRSQDAQHKLQNEISRSERLESDSKRLRAQLQQCKEEYDASVSKATTTELAVTRLEAEKKACHEEMTRLKQQLAETAERLSTVQAEFDKFKVNANSARTQGMQQIAEYASRQQHLEQSLADRVAECRSLQAAVGDARAQLLEAEKRITEERQHVVEVERKAEDAQRQLRMQLEELRRAEEKVRDEKEDFRLQLRDADQRIEASTRHQTDLQATINNLHKEIADAKEAQRQAELRENNVRQELAQQERMYQAKLAKLDTDMQHMAAMQQQFNQAVAKVHGSLSQARHSGCSNAANTPV